MSSSRTKHTRPKVVLLRRSRFGGLRLATTRIRLELVYVFLKPLPTMTPMLRTQLNIQKVSF